jgi:hypothetical protein
MNIMAYFEDKLQCVFTQPTQIHGEPTYETIIELRRTLKHNAASIPCTLGGAQHGYLALVVSETAYAMISNVPFAIPDPPTLHPTIPNGATAAQITELTSQHIENIRVFNEYLHVQTALKKQIIDSIDPLFLNAAQDHNDHNVRFAHETVRDLLDHLIQEYVDTTGQGLDNNFRRMREPWNPDSPFETLVVQINKGMEYADLACCSFSPTQILWMAERLIFNTGIFHDDIKVWQATPDDTKTWSTFQTFFRQAHRRYRRQKDTAQQAGYHATYAAFCMETTEHIAYLTHKDRTQIEILQNLTNQLANMRKEMKDIEKEINHSQQQRNVPTSKGTTTNTARGELAMSRMMKMLARPDNGNYCWTHGYVLGYNHMSCTCNKKKPGHIDDATRQNPQGGSTRGKAERGL